MAIHYDLGGETRKALKPVKTGLALPFHILGKAMPYVAKVAFLPIHGINYLIQKGIMKKTNPYNGARITKVSNWVGNGLAKIPYGIENGIKRF